MPNLDDESFDIVFDKGTLDTLACCPDRYHKLPIYTKEILRVLKPGGIWLVISFGPPETRDEIFQDKRNEAVLTVEHSEVGKNKDHHVYIVRPALPEADPALPVADGEAP